MIPPPSDPKWNKFLTSLNTIQARELPTKMFVLRLKTKVMFDHSEAVKQTAIREAHDFFTKNQAALKGDIQLIFG